MLLEWLGIFADNQTGCKNASIRAASKGVCTDEGAIEQAGDAGKGGDNLNKRCKTDAQSTKLHHS